MIPTLQQGQFGRTAVGEIDVLGASVALLLHMDGSNGGTTFTDHSLAARTVTPTGVVTSTAQSVFGGASAYAASGGASLVVASNSDLIWGQDFTLEWRMYVSSYPAGDVYIMGDVNNNGHYIVMSSSGVITMQAGVSVVVGTISLSTWTSFAVTQTGVTKRGFKDGVLVDTTSTSAFTDANNPVQFGIFKGTTFGGSYTLIGYIDELRFTKACRYTGSYTVRTSPFPNP